MARQKRTVPYHRYTVTRKSRLEEAARERLKDAQALREADRHLGAQYLGGYVVECLLKSIICSEASPTPEKRAYGCRYGEIRLEETEATISRQRGRTLSLRTHELEVLLDYADLKNSIQVEGLWRQFSIVNQWSSELRYYSGKATSEQSEKFLKAIFDLLPFLYTKLWR